MTIDLQTKINELPLVGPQLTKAFYNIGVETVEDLIYNFPTRYMDYRKKVNIARAEEDEVVTIVGRIKNIRANHGFRSRLSFTDATIEDGTGTIKAIWFNQTYIAKSLSLGDEIILSGKVGRFKQLQLTNPAYEKLTPDDENVEHDESGQVQGLHTGRLVPIYRRSDLIPLRTMRRLVKSCLPAAEELEDFLSAKLAKEHGLLSIAEAVRFLHFPETDEQIQDARLRIAVDDILPQQVAVQLRKSAFESSKTFPIKTDVEKVKLFLKTLPFELTASQKRAAWDIFQDLESGRPMNRLLQGDVGSGKTIVAILAALQTAGNGFQTVLLAPTEILAKQHYETFGQILGTQSGIGLLTRAFAEADSKILTKADLTKRIEKGEVQICIGTHALLQEKVKFKKLALVVIDEQHRFGVSQRGQLLTSDGKIPHLLSMSATPIPRTLAMSLYADLAVSTLKQVPTGRKPVQTFVVPESKREEAYQFVRQEAGAGHQAFVVTPRVEESEIKSKAKANTGENNASGETLSEIKSVKKEFARLQAEVFPNLRLGLLYGKMKAADKDAVMTDFANGKLDILVSTSVIEIGIDIPQATTMIIEGSERFGLAQLHQLRGRIGRNNYDCKCFLFTTEASQQETRRLTALTKTNDGFVLAELDLRDRGFGDLFGKKQSGFLFRYPQFINLKALEMSRDLALKLMKHEDKINKTLLEEAQSYLTEVIDN